MIKNNERKLYRAVYKLLLPLVKLLIRQGMPHSVFADVARHAYVDAATKEFTIPGRKQSISRVSVLTGINRKDIAKLRKRPHPLENDAANQYNRAHRVINAWLRDGRFQNEQGNPRPLPFDGDEFSFSELVRLYSGDVPVRALLDELQRIKAVSINNEEQVSLLTQAYLPQEDTAEKLRIFGNAAADLLSTLNHNLEKGSLQARFQRTVAYANIPEESLSQIRIRSQEEMQELIIKINQWLCQHDRDVNPQVIGKGQVRAGIGIYYFEEDLDSGSQE